MRTFNVHEAKTHFSRLLAEVEAGASLTIARAGKPVARLVPVAEGEGQPFRSRLGGLEGQGDELLAIFDNWTEADQARLEALFYGEADAA
ncbi:MAG: type II toxin-antitoxin system prevent-host-death family antitoxin [Sphingomonadaceae bacterium]|nr:type II toxin-antitoxin system prevent-host-death family antitoxin [Sphingomonadaceae bacterium]